MAATKPNPVIWPQRFSSAAAARRFYAQSGRRGGARFVRSGSDTVIVEGAVSEAMAKQLVSGLMGPSRPRGENPADKAFAAGVAAAAKSGVKATASLIGKWFSAWKSKTEGVMFTDRAAFTKGANSVKANPLKAAKEEVGLPDSFKSDWWIYAGDSAKHSDVSEVTDSATQAGKRFAALKKLDYSRVALFKRRKTGGYQLRKSHGSAQNALITRQERGKADTHWFTLGGKTYGPYSTIAERESERKRLSGLKQSAAEKFMAKYRRPSGKNPGKAFVQYVYRTREFKTLDAARRYAQEDADELGRSVFVTRETSRPPRSQMLGPSASDFDTKEFEVKPRKKTAAPAKNGGASGSRTAKNGDAGLPIMTVTHGAKRADIYQDGPKVFEVRIAGQKPETLSTIKAAASWARLKLAEVANQPAKLKSKLAAALAKRINPRSNPKRASEEMYEMFHGLPAEKTIEYREQVHVHEYLWAAGTLVSMVILGPRGGEMTLRAPDPDDTEFSRVVMVCFSEDGKQLYFRGGDQDLPIDEIAEAFALTDDDVREQMEIGRVKKLTYRTFKNFEENGEVPIDFFHALGKEHAGGVLPILCYKPLDPSMFLVGGRYKIAPKDRTLGASPGVVG